MNDQSRVRIFMLPGSNACLTAALMLEHKRVDYDRVDYPPALHALIVRLRGFPRTTVPAMQLGSRRIQGTLAISEALDAVFPAAPLFPEDAEARTAVREAEVWGEKFQNACRRIFYGTAQRDTRVFRTFIRGGTLAAPAAFAVRAAAPLIIRLASAGHGATDERVRQDLARLPENLDRIDGYLERGTLGGSVLNAADYQIAPNVRATLHFADLAPYLEGRPCASWAKRVVPEYGGPIAPALPPEWLPPRTTRGGRTGVAESL
jgi:glutathione S-transferase